MIHFAVPDKQGGVCDFSRILQSEMGTDMVNVVPLSVSNATAWEIQSATDRGHHSTFAFSQSWNI